MDKLDALFRKFYPSLILFANKFTQDIEASKELVQELFISLYEKQDSLNIKQSPKSYLFQAVRNRALNYLQKQKREHAKREVFAESQNGNYYLFNDPLEASEFEAQIFQLIQALPPACQRVFAMSRLEGKKNQEIADQLQISKRTVETQISKALKILREKIHQSDFTPSVRQLLVMFLF